MTKLDNPLLKQILPVAPESLIGDLILRDDPLFGIVWINPTRVSGTPCFFGTRVPVQTLFNCLAAGQKLDEFLDDFDGVSRDQAQAVLRLAACCFLERLPPS